MIFSRVGKCLTFASIYLQVSKQKNTRLTFSVNLPLRRKTNSVRWEWSKARHNATKHFSFSQKTGEQQGTLVLTPLGLNFRFPHCWVQTQHIRNTNHFQCSSPQPESTLHTRRYFRWVNLFQWHFWDTILTHCRKFLRKLHNVQNQMLIWTTVCGPQPQEKFMPVKIQSKLVVLLQLQIPRWTPEIYISSHYFRGRKMWWGISKNLFKLGILGLRCFGGGWSLHGWASNCWVWAPGKTVQASFQWRSNLQAQQRKVYQISQKMCFRFGDEDVCWVCKGTGSQLVVVCAS